MKKLKQLITNALMGGAILAFLLSSSTMYAQSGFTLSWDSEVGCLEYGYDEKREAPFEEINEDDCLLICEEGTINFTLEYDGQDISEITWETNGGDIISGGNEETVETYWPEAYDNGSITVNVTLTNNQTYSQSLCVTVKPKPKGGFEIIGKVSEFFCSESELFFENNAYVEGGGQIVSTVWDFGDGNYSNDFSPSHTYSEEGEYTITLTVYDECNCSMTRDTKVVITKAGLQISCPTVVCENALETYTISGTPYMNGDVICYDYVWKVEGGEIVNSGQDWIDVEWNDVGLDGFGYVYFEQNSCEVTCDNILVAQIPVITEEGTITGGKTKLCLDEQSRYSIPRWPTTDVEWKIMDANNLSSTFNQALVLVDQRNEVVIDAAFLTPGVSYILKANYVNTLLGCGGEAEFLFSVLNDLTINETSFEDEICQGNTATFQLTNTVPNVTWSIIKEGNVVATVPGTGNGSHATYQFNDPGLYTVSASANGYCTKYTQIEVTEVPDVTDAEILGSIEVCPNVGEVYTFVGETNGFEVKWIVDQGEFLGGDVGESVTIKFTPGYTSYEVSAYLFNPFFDNCISESIILEVDLFEPDAEIVQTTGSPLAICTSSIENFDLVGYPDMDYYEWVIQPEELANVSSGQGTENVSILFNEPFQGVTEGVIKVLAKVCGNMTVIDEVNFKLNQNPVITLTNVPAEVCPNTPFAIQVSSSPIISASSLSLSFEGSSNTYNAIHLGQGVYTFQNITLSNANPYEQVNLSFTINGNGSEFCEEVNIPGIVVRKPAPVLQISINDGANTFCNENDINTVLVANLQGVGTQESNIVWHKTGSQQAVGTGATFYPSTFGTYYAQATNSPYGCSSSSSVINIIQDCADLVIPCVNQSVSLTFAWSACDVIKLTATYTGNPISKSFTPIGGFTSTNITPMPATTTGNTLVQEFTTKNAGTYIFFFEAEYPNCSLVSDLMYIDVEYMPLMLKSVECSADAYEVTILNQSTRMPNSNPTANYSFVKNPGGQIILPDFADDNEAVATLGNGEYTLTLTLSSPGKPTCEVSETIELQLPNADFSILPNQNPTCAENPVLLEPDNPTPGASYLWEFQLASNTMQVINPNLAPTLPIGESITLTVTDPYGCSHDTSHTIAVNKAEFTGFLGATPSEICNDLNLVSLSFTLIGGANSTPEVYSWYHVNNGLLSTSSNPAYQVNNPDAGEYWMHIVDNNGCEDKGISSVFVSEIQSPHLTAQITGSVCLGEDIVLNGVLFPQTAEYQISRKKDNDPYAVVQAWTAGSSIFYTDANLAVGQYTYKVEYKDPQTTCAAESYFDAVVNPTPTVSITMGVPSCEEPYEPYAVELTATGNQPGTYTWSNGDEGDAITVSHGGPYQVRFKPDGADCEAVATVIVPKSPDEYTWIFPTGCFEYCDSIMPAPYIIGPIPHFNGGNHYSLDDHPITDDIGLVPDLSLVNMEGNLSLYLNNGFCDTTTEYLHVEKTNCEQCKVEIFIKDAKKDDSEEGYPYFMLIGHIENPFNQTVTVQLTSPEGEFVPSVITIPGNSAYIFDANPIEYIPTGVFSAVVHIQYVVTGNFGNGVEILCSDLLTIDLGDLSNSKPAKDVGIAHIRVAPNPVKNTANIHYDIQNIEEYNGGTIRVYDLSGRLLKSVQVIETQGTTSIDLNHMAAGAYIVVFKNKDQILGRQVLMKE